MQRRAELARAIINCPSVMLLDEAKQKAIKAIWETRPIFALQGPPGTGKTTCAIALARDLYGGDGWAGRVLELVRVRRKIGFIFQAHNLMGSLTARDNVTLPIREQLIVELYSK